jgi:hypothetical protein
MCTITATIFVCRCPWKRAKASKLYANQAFWSANGRHFANGETQQ